MGLFSKPHTHNPDKRARMCEHQQFTFESAYKKPEEKSWKKEKNGTDQDIGKIAKITCPKVPDGISGGVAYEGDILIGAADFARDVIARIACGSCRYFGKKPEEINLILAGEAESRTILLQAQLRELEAGKSLDDQHLQ